MDISSEKWHGPHYYAWDNKSDGSICNEHWLLQKMDDICSVMNDHMTHDSWLYLDVVVPIFWFGCACLSRGSLLRLCVSLRSQRTGKGARWKSSRASCGATSTSLGKTFRCGAAWMRVLVLDFYSMAPEWKHTFFFLLFFFPVVMLENIKIWSWAIMLDIIYIYIYACWLREKRS